MKENRGMKTTVVDIKEYSSKEVSLLTQVILTEMLFIFSIIILLNNLFMPVFYAIVVMLMLNMAYNNNKFYKKKYMTFIYIVVSLFVAITTILEYFL